VGSNYTGLYLLIPSTGESRLINPIYVDTTGQGTADDLILAEAMMHVGMNDDTNAVRSGPART